MECARSEKLPVDFTRVTRLRASMGTETGEDMVELVVRLRTLAGMIMENASADAVLGPAESGAEGLRDIRLAAEDAATLIKAAEVVLSRAPSG